MFFMEPSLFFGQYCLTMVYKINQILDIYIPELKGFSKL